MKNFYPPLLTGSSSVKYYYPPIVAPPAGDDQATYVLTTPDTGLINSKVLQPGTGIIVSVIGGQVFISANGASGGGTVTSIALAMPPEFTVSGSPIVSSGTLTATKNNQTANKFYAAPDGSTGAPVFRLINANDFYLSLLAGQNIALSNAGGILTIAATAIWPGSIIGTIPASSGGLGTSTAPTAGQVPIGVTGGTYIPATVVAGPGVQINTGSGFMNIGASGAQGGTVTSVALTPPASIISVSGSPIVGSGTFTESLQSQSASTFWGGPIQGSASPPWFRAIVGTDLGLALSPGANVTFSNSGSSLTINSSNPGGTVTSVGDFSPLFTTATRTTTPAFTAINQASGQVYASPQLGTGIPLFRTLASSDIYAALSQNLIAGANVTVTPNGATANTITISAAGSSNTNGTVTLVSVGNLTNFATTNVATAATTPNVTYSLTQAGSGQFWGGSISGSSAAPNYRLLTLSDMPSGVATNSLTAAHIFLGNSSNIATDTAVTGDINISVSGSVTVQPHVISSAKFRQSAALSVVSNPTALTADVTDLVAGAGSLVLASNAACSALSFRNVASGDFGPNLLDYTHGGTGLSATPTNGQLDIGNGAGFSRATLTPGSGIQITNSAGGITLSSYASAALLSVGNVGGWFTTTNTNGAVTFTASATKGDLPFYSNTNTDAKLAIGNTTQVVGVSSGGIPTYLNTLQGFASAVVSASLTPSSKSAQYMDASAANITLTLQAASSMPEKIFWFKNITVTGSNTCTVATNGTDTFEVGTSLTILKLQTPGIISDGVSRWRYLEPQVKSPVAGGTGSNVVPTDGQIPIGSTSGLTYTPGNITAIGLTVVNGPNSISLLNYASGGGSGGSGTVTSVSDLVPLFTTANRTTTPTFSFSNAPSGTYFGNLSGAASGPGYYQATFEMGILIDGASSTLSPGDEGQFRCPVACQIVGWTILAQSSTGNCQFQVYTSTYASFPSMSSLIGSGTKPSITAAQKNQNLAISDWTGGLSLSAGQIIKFTLESVTNFSQITISLTAIRTG